MDDIELKKLGKQELIALLQAEKRKNEALANEVEELRSTLGKREIAINNAGSIAEASLQLSGVFEAAQRAADEYIENCRRLTSRSDEIAEEREARAKVKAQKILNDAQVAAKAKLDIAESMIVNAEKESARIRQEADAYWENVQARLQKFYDEHRGLREMLQVMRNMDK